MALRKIDFEVTEKGSLGGVWIRVDEDIVTLNGGKGSVRKQSGKNYLLQWFFLGDPGESISIVGKVGDQTVVEIKKSIIPPGENSHGGQKRFFLS